MQTRCKCLADTVPVLTRCGEGNTAYSFRHQTTRIVVPAEATSGACAIWMHIAQPGFSPPRHIHQREDEILHVLTGQLYVCCGGATFTVNPGDTATLSRGLPHSFCVTGRDPARMMVTVVPGGSERFYAEVAALRLPNDIPDLIDISETFGISYAGRPLLD